jgi:catechol 2,3-dioxygenase-like lactoylglutathione lyase family enzyme
MRLLHHTCIGTNDMDKAVEFYTSILRPLGASVVGTVPGHSTMFGTEEGPEFFILNPANGKPATTANGGTYGFKSPTREGVDKFHANGLALGATDEGAPGPRDFAPNAYAAYLRDPEGNKICAVCFAAP